MWGIIPAAGSGTRIQPLAFSKELLPVGCRRDERGVERPRAVSEYLIERMVRAGADKICFVISPWKTDILQYYSGNFGRATIAYAIQAQTLGLCDAIFRCLPLLHPDDSVMVGLPDTIWFPEDALCRVPTHTLSFLLFPVARPELFDAVVTGGTGRVTEIQVKTRSATSSWVWGAFRAPVHVMQELHRLWRQRGRQDEYLGSLVNAYIASGGEALGVQCGESYVDVGTLHGYREAMHLLQQADDATKAAL
ncbi:MAG: nucleotidyltransferase family protein [Acetobacteraceae bacterium]|nr:nucleotidyltransferase family protein [Acetobacteraceae bacterium]